ncbi:hypothetical protein IE53DRAFT_178546 [Violaceomyces palustris]|uniref:Uncharacterized protein n=1 Tax=Violaceomyces palustris TaxID=1673888 RepID=A0ACD0NSI3_9BASI|nr:hypothetical protein IE53DRAFT_178546 [Violaceomyces palustris]
MTPPLIPIPTAGFGYAFRLDWPEVVIPSFPTAPSSHFLSTQLRNPHENFLPTTPPPFPPLFREEEGHEHPTFTLVRASHQKGLFFFHRKSGREREGGGGGGKLAAKPRRQNQTQRVRQLARGEDGLLDPSASDVDFLNGFTAPGRGVNRGFGQGGGPRKQGWDDIESKERGRAVGWLT